MKEVYVVVEEGSWDYESTNDVAVFDSFEKALENFNYRVSIAQFDMSSWTDDIASEQTINEATQSASFEIYEDGDFTRLHDTIQILKKEVK